MAASNKSKKLISYSADFEQVKKLISYFADFEQVKKLATKLLCGETGCLCIFFFFFSHPTLSSLTLWWTIARFLNPFYTFSPAQHRVIHNIAPPNPIFFF